MPRSLVAFAGEAYTHHLHGIDQVRRWTSANSFSCGALTVHVKGGQVAL